MAFGMGRSICPGRFLVANEYKIVLARMLLDYEVRLSGEGAGGCVFWV